ncbi:protein of unknown function [Pseudomonas sp. JV551A1]|nr:protein of unknown function [Pseudomonas sp. JV551A1]
MSGSPYLAYASWHWDANVPI